MHSANLRYELRRPARWLRRHPALQPLRRQLNRELALTTPTDTFRSTWATSAALGIGVLLGACLSLANVQLGLRTGWIDSGAVAATLIAFALLRPIGRSSPVELMLAQALATAAAVMPAAMGIIGPLPVLRSASSVSSLLFGLAVALLGLAMGGLLRTRLIERAALPFPTGTVTGQLIEALQARGRETTRTRELIFSIVPSALLSLGRDPLQLLPAVLRAPAWLGGSAAARLTAGLATSPMLWGVGVLVGPRIAGSVVAGGVLAWLGMAPWLVGHGQVGEASFDALVAWLMWPGVGITVGAGLGGLGVERWRAWRNRRAAADRQVSRTTAPSGPIVALVLALAILVVLLQRWLFAMSYVHAAIGLVLALAAAYLCARSAGEVDVAPAGTVAQLGLLVLVAAGLRDHAGLLATAVLLSGAGAHCAQTLWSLRAARHLGLSPRPVLVMTLVGTVLGAAVAWPLYRVLLPQIGSAILPAPSVAVWRSFVSIAERGADAIPPSAIPAAVAASIFGAVVGALAAARPERVWLSPAAMALGFLLPLHDAAALFCAALLVSGIRLGRKEVRDEAPTSDRAIGAGLIIGDSLATTALLAARALIHG